MQLYKPALLFALLALPLMVEAQMFSAPVKNVAPKAEAVKEVATPKISDIAAPTTGGIQKVSAQDIMNQLTAEINQPVGMTPEEKATVKLPLTEQIMNDVDKADLRERRQLLDAMAVLDKTAIRRQNLSLPENKQIKVEKPRVNAASKRDVQKYMQERLVDPIDRTLNIE